MLPSRNSLGIKNQTSLVKRSKSACLFYALLCAFVSPVAFGQNTDGPDLEVGTPTVSDSNVATGASITLSATVTNGGDAESAATTLRFYRSTDSTITTSDTSVGSVAIGTIAASASESESVGETAPSTTGTYYYGACVDSVTDESDTTNNCSESLQVTVREPAPDLVVLAPSVGDDTPEPGESFRILVTVHNQGEVRSAATTLRYYRSTDATITTSDTEVDTDAVSARNPGTASAETASLTAPTTAGTYYYGACVDSVTDESDTANNCSSSVSVVVSAVTEGPDLVVGAPTVDDSSVGTGAAFTLSATVRNSGDESSAATTLRYYRSTDTTITTSDTEVGTDSVGALSVTATSPESVDLTAPSTVGTYYYGACVDTVTDESDATNNCSSVVWLVVSDPAPDLEVDPPTVDDSSMETGASFTLSATVRNPGDEGSVATTLRYYRSTDATITTSDTEVATDSVGALSASATSSESVDLTAPSTAGTYYYGACVDSVTDESDTANNCSSAVSVVVSEPAEGPDLEVRTPTVDNGSVEPGASFTLSATVRNSGNESSAATTLRYYRSTDATISGTDTEVGTDSVGALSASATSSESVDLTAPSTAGTYYYGACVDSVTGESDTTNNCSSSVSVVVSKPADEDVSRSPDGPDLVVDMPTVDDSSPRPDASFTLSATVRNVGNESSALTSLRYYLSTDATITTLDSQVRTRAVGALSPSGASTESVSVTALRTAGTYYYGACVLSVPSESDTTNNCSSAVSVVVSEPAEGPDLEVVPLTVTNTSPIEGSSFALYATVSNDGDVESAATTLRYYQSTDETISSADTEVGTDAVGALTAGGTSPGGSPSGNFVVLWAPSPAGTYYYGACVDAVTGESDTTNNCSGSVSVEVQEATIFPELQVSQPTVVESTVVAGGKFRLSTTVTNHGDGGSAPTTLRYYRSVDATISSADTEVGTDTVQGLTQSVGMNGTSLESIDQTAPSTAGMYYYGACVDAVPVESDTANNCSPSVAVEVVEATTSPELQVGQPTVTNSTTVAGGSFTLSVTVSNAGDGASAATTLRYYLRNYQLTDGTISNPNSQVGTDEVEALAASETSAESISLTARSTAGTYYYGVCVDAVPLEWDTTNNCASSVSVVVTESEGSQSSSASSPTQVSGVVVTPGVGELVVTWTAVSDAGAYQVEWKSGEESYDESRQAEIAGSDTVKHTITGLTAGTEYAVRVTATKENADDGTPSEEEVGIPKAAPPDRVTGVEVSVGVELLELSWTAVSEASGYKVQWKSGVEDFDDSRQAEIASSNTTTHTITDLTTDTEYTLRVIATRDIADDGAPSEEVTATPVSADPDVNGDGTLDGNDALIMYNSYASEGQLGDGETGGTAASRQSLLAGYSGKDNPSDDELKEMIRNAHAWQDAGLDVGGDINEDGEIDESDAFVLYYAYANANMVGNGTTGGTARFRQLLLAAFANKDNPTDEDLKAMLRRANKLREDFS